MNDALQYSENKDEINYQIGLAYQSQKKFKEASVYFKNAIEININHENALYDLAYCQEINGELENSVHYYKKFIDEDPYSEYAWFNLGNIFLKLKSDVKFL